MSRPVKTQVQSCVEEVKEFPPSVPKQKPYSNADHMYSCYSISINDAVYLTLTSYCYYHNSVMKPLLKVANF